MSLLTLLVQSAQRHDDLEAGTEPRATLLSFSHTIQQQIFQLITFHCYTGTQQNE
jgi:hypothetical protein